MPVEKTKNALASKLKAKGADKILKKHANDELKYDTGGSLPTFENGVAQLTSIKWGEFEKGENKGEPYFLAMATIVSPKDVMKDGVKVRLEGKQTKRGPIALCEEKGRDGKVRRSFDDNLAAVQACLRKLGASSEAVEDIDSLEATAEELVEIGPYFACRAWQGKKEEVEEKGGKFIYRNTTYASMDALKKANPYYDRDPMVNEVWDKVMPEFVPADAADVEDNSAVANGKGDVKAKGKTKKEEPEEEEEVEEEAEGTDEEPDLDSLGEAGDGGDEDAQKELVKLAKDAGITQKQIDGSDNWAALAEMVKEKVAESGEDEPEEEEAAEEEAEEEEEVEEEVIPKKGDIWKYKPVDPKTKKAAKKAIEVDIISVDKKTKKVDAKNLDSGKVIKGIAWDKLIQE